MSIRSARPVLLALAVLAACGGSGDGGTGPDSGGGGAGGGGGGNGGGGGGSSNNDRIVSISVTPNALTLEVGATATLSAEGTTEGGQRVSTGFSWRTANAAVATVSAAGQVTAVAPGTTSVQAVSGSVQGAATVTVPSPPVPPAAPSDLEAREIDATSVELTWTDNSTDETGFEIQRAAPDSAFVQLAVTAADTTGYVDAAVPRPGVWTYRVRALGTPDASGFSGSAAVEVRPADSLVSIRITPDTLTLDVGAGATLVAEGTTARGARVTEGFAWRSLDPAIATVSDSGAVTAVAPGTTTIAASIGAVAGSAAVTVTPPPMPPAAPSDLQARARDATSVDLRWTDNSTDETGFEIERAPAGGAYVVVGTAAADSTTFRDMSVPAPGVWSYRLRALGDSLASAFTEAVELEVSTVAPVRRAVARIEQVVDSLIPRNQPRDNRDLPGELVALMPILVEDEDVLAVHVDTGAAIAQVVLKSGLSVLITNNKVPFASDLAAASRADALTAFLRAPRPVPPRRAQAPWSRTGPFGTTSGAKAAGVVSIGGGASTAGVLRSVLSSGGYEARTLGSTVEAFRQYKGLGAIYVDSHAAAWQEVEQLERDDDGDVTGWDPGLYGFGIETETVIWESDLDRYIDELFDGDLIITVSTWVEGITPRRAKLAVTEGFIEKHWELDDAIAILHICFGGADLFTAGGPCRGVCPANAWKYRATPIREAMLAAGAQVVLAFDNYIWPSTSQPTMQYFFDRLSGSNVIAPFTEPARRPFNLAKVRQGMQEQDLLRHRKGSAIVNAVFATTVPDIDIIGVPSIEQVLVSDDAARSSGELRLSGTFSDGEGTLTVGGAPASVESWTKNTIVARTPFAGNGATGDVLVESPGGLRSNAVPMTEWRGAITFSVEPNAGTLKGTLEANVIFRADVHKPRTSVEGDPIAVPVATYISPATFAQVRGTGSNTDANGTVEFFGADEARILTKAEVDQKVGGLPNATERFFGGQVTFDTEARTARICFSGAGPVRVRETSADGGVAEFEAPLLGTLYPDLFDELDGLMGCLNLPMNDAFTIPAGRRVVNAGEGPDAVTLTLDWTDFTASNAPDDETKG